MKKVFSAICVVAILLTACSKEGKLNKKLDGDWNVTMASGQVIVAPTVVTITFGKDKKDNGTYSINFTDGVNSSVETGSYTLEDDTKITLTDVTDPTDPSIFTITEYSKTTLKMTESDGTLIEATKK